MLPPEARLSSGWPGTAMTSRPWSSAARAVMSDPDRAAASTTITACARPETMRLRRGKWRPCGCNPKGISLSLRPVLPILPASSAFSAG
jgi:hypothetical protein